MFKSTIVITRENKWFVGRSLELGVVSQGKSIEECKKNLFVSQKGSHVKLRKRLNNRTITTVSRFIKNLPAAHFWAFWNLLK